MKVVTMFSRSALQLVMLVDVDVAKKKKKVATHKHIAHIGKIRSYDVVSHSCFHFYFHYTSTGLELATSTYTKRMITNVIPFFQPIYCCVSCYDSWNNHFFQQCSVIIVVNDSIRIAFDILSSLNLSIASPSTYYSFVSSVHCTIKNGTKER